MRHTQSQSMTISSIQKTNEKSTGKNADIYQRKSRINKCLNKKIPTGEEGSLTMGWHRWWAFCSLEDGSTGHLRMGVLLTWEWECRSLEDGSSGHLRMGVPLTWEWEFCSLEDGSSGRSHAWTDLWSRWRWRLPQGEQWAFSFLLSTFVFLPYAP